jgi:hypothetical protein
MPFRKDIIGISTPVTKWNYQITEASEIPEAKALHCTIRTSRARLVDITKMRNLMNLSSVIKNAQILEVIIQNQL